MIVVEFHQLGIQQIGQDQAAQQNRDMGDDADKQGVPQGLPEQRITEHIPVVLQADKVHVRQAVPAEKAEQEAGGHGEQVKDQKKDIERGNIHICDPVLVQGGEKPLLFCLCQIVSHLSTGLPEKGRLNCSEADTGPASENRNSGKISLRSKRPHPSGSGSAGASARHRRFRCPCRRVHGSAPRFHRLHNRR